MTARLFYSLQALVYALGLIAILATGARAHDWYPWECCHAQDCAPMGEAMQEPLPKPAPGGWLLDDGMLIPYSQARTSPDGKFHICRRNGERSGALIAPDKRPVCFWAPQPSF